MLEFKYLKRASFYLEGTKANEDQDTYLDLVLKEY